MINRVVNEAHGVACAGGGDAAGSVAAGWLAYAAAPTFAVMALWTGLSGGQPDMLCMTVHGAFPLNGMSAMYALMGMFHAAPWLALIASRRPGECQSGRRRRDRQGLPAC